MQANRRRTIMTAGILLVGLGLILLDAPVPLLLAGTASTGLIVLVLTGGFQSAPVQAQPKPAREQREPSTPPQKSKRPRSSILQRFRTRGETSEQRSGDANRARKETGIWRRSIQFLLSRIHRSRTQTAPVPDPSAHLQKIDAMLDSLITNQPEPVPAPSAGAKRSSLVAGSGLGLGSLKELTDAELEEDLLTEDAGDKIEDLEGGIETPDLTRKDSVPIDQDGDSDQGNAILNVQGGEQEEMHDLDLMDLSGLQMDQLNSELESMDLGEPESPPQKETAPMPSPPKQQDAPPKAAIPVPASLPGSPVEGKEILAFAQAQGGGADLLLALKSDVAHIKKPKDLSLLRDLKDEQVDAGNLAGDLESLSTLLKGRGVGKRREPSP